MGITFHSAIVAINWANSNFYVITDQQGVLPYTVVDHVNLTRQPVETAIELTENVIPLTKRWFNCNLKEAFVVDNKLNLVYSTIIPYDPEFKPRGLYHWTNILEYFGNDYLRKAVEKSVSGIS